VQRGSVRGLTTAATIWLTAAIGAAAAAGLPLLAVLCTAGHFHRAIRTDAAGTAAVRAPTANAVLSCTYIDGPRRTAGSAAHLHRLRLGGDESGDPAGNGRTRSGGRAGPPLVRVGWSCTARVSETGLIAALDDVRAS
jgi:hypothetical protein